MPDIELMGSIFPDVPAVDLPQSGGGTARLYDPTNLVTLDTTQTVTGAKTFQNVINIQNGNGTGSLWIGGNVNANTATNNQRHLARIVVPSYANVTLGATLLGFDSSGDSDMHLAGKTYDVVSFGGMKKITNATSPMGIVFCVANERAATAANKKVYALELDSNEARFNVPPNYNGVDLATVNQIPTGLPSVTSSDNGKILTVVNGAWAAASLPIYNGGVS